MIESTFLDYISKFKATSYAGIEDFADKFNFIFTVIVLSLSTVIITAKSYLLKPIACYISTEIGGTNLLNYVENYCWVQGTIPISYANRMPSTDKEWEELENAKIREFQFVSPRRFLVLFKQPISSLFQSLTIVSQFIPFYVERGECVRA